MRQIRELEKAIMRAEGALCVVLVLVMLLLAGYNVLYRNVLVPLQSRWAHSGPPIETQVKPDAKAPSGKAKAKSKSDAKGGGFGGAFGGDDEEEDADDEPEEGKGGGFGGGFGEGADEEEEGEGDDDGFGGAFGEPAGGEDEDDGKDGDEFFVEDEFSDLPDINPAGGPAGAPSGPQGGPPEPGSFAAWGVDFVSAIKLDWIDVFLRQLVIIVSFLGAAIATRREKHINIDALSKILKANGRRIVAVLTNLLAVGVCMVLANAGNKLVAIGREYPRELVPFADQWMFQLMFPIGFGLLAFHFGVRLLEAATGTVPLDPAEVAAGKVSPPGDAPRSTTAAEDDEDADEAEDEEDEEDADDSSDAATDVSENSEETAPGEVPAVEEPPEGDADEKPDEDKEPDEEPAADADDEEGDR